MEVLVVGAKDFVRLLESVVQATRADKSTNLVHSISYTLG